VGDKAVAPNHTQGLAAKDRVAVLALFDLGIERCFLTCLDYGHASDAGRSAMQQMTRKRPAVRVGHAIRSCKVGGVFKVLEQVSRVNFWRQLLWSSVVEENTPLLGQFLTHGIPRRRA
jgi:hypothetical protein